MPTELSRQMTFARDGAQRVRSGVDVRALRDISDAVADLPFERAGSRIYGDATLRRLLASPGAVGIVAASVLGRGCQPVRAVLLDKTPATNWSVPWHQDRTIAVAERVEVAGFGPWTVKSGLLHVAPPFDVLAAMLT